MARDEFRRALHGNTPSPGALMRGRVMEVDSIVLGGRQCSKVVVHGEDGQGYLMIGSTHRIPVEELSAGMSVMLEFVDSGRSRHAISSDDLDNLGDLKVQDVGHWRIRRKL